VTTIYSNSIEIEWRQGGISDVSYYIVKYKESEDQEEFTSVNYDWNYKSQLASTTSSVDKEGYIVLNTTSTKVKLGTTLKPYTLYEFKVVAVNSLGESEETEVISARTAATSEFRFQSAYEKCFVIGFSKFISEPGQVKNIRYTYINESTYIIRCDQPDDVNGNLKVRVCFTV